MPTTSAARDRASALTGRFAAVRSAYFEATALAQLHGYPVPPYSHLGALGLLDHFPAMIAAGTAPGHLLHAAERLLTLVERELAHHNER